MRSISVLILLFFLISCSSTSKSETSDKGEVFYKEKCGGCHRIYKKKEFGKADWENIFSKMKAKSKLSDSESRLILYYLTN